MGGHVVYQPQYAPYGQYGVVHQGQYGVIPQVQYGVPPQQYGVQQQYGSPQPQYGIQQPQYGVQQPQYGMLPSGQIAMISPGNFGVQVVSQPDGSGVQLPGPLTPSSTGRSQ
jgi:hypothetical protein